MTVEDAPRSLPSSRRHFTHADRVRHALERFPRSAFPELLGSAQLGSGPDPVPPEPVLRTMLEALELTGTERVLELGSSTAYQVALLSQLSGHVVSVVPDAASAAERGRRLAQLGCGNVEVVVGVATDGWVGGAPYFAILVDAGTTHVAAQLLDQLELGGCMVVPLGDPSGQLIELVRSRADGCSSETRGCCHLPMLPSASRRPSTFPWRQA